MSELDWIVEQEELPPDEPYVPAPEPQPPRRWQLPVWAWVVGGIVVVASLALVILWILGGADDPLPSPEPELASLAAAVELEIGALNNGDREIYERQQDIASRRRYHQPPIDVWFGAKERSGQFSLIELQPLGAAEARAFVRLDWEGTPYRLAWAYRQEDGRWLHTDWVPGQLTATLSLTTTHLVVEYHQEEAREAAVLAERTEELITSLCDLLTCAAEPIRVTLAFDPLYVSSGVHEDADSLRLPSPLRIRWPLNGEPEPLVMGSLARHLAQRLVVSPASAGLSEESRDALSLIAFWLAHRLLGLETLPGTTWLEEVEARVGMATVAAVAEAIARGVPPQQAVRGRLHPETVAAVTEQPGYLAWVALISHPIRLLTAFDDVANPWAPAGESYREIYPALVEVVYRGEWAVGLTDHETPGPEAVFFQQRGGDWRVVYSPDESLIGEPKELVTGPFRITYYAWDEPYIDQIVEMLTKTYERVMANFGLAGDMAFEVMVIPYPNYSGGGSEITVQWPTLNTWIGKPAISDQTPLMVAGSFLGQYLTAETLVEERYFTLIGLLLWQLDDLEIAPQRWYQLIGFPPAEEWRPPRTVDDPRWLPLTQLWQRPTSEPSEEEMAQYLWIPYLLTTYIVDTYGRETVRTMSDALTTADSIDAWIETVTGESRPEFEMKWRAWVLSWWENR